MYIYNLNKNNGSTMRIKIEKLLTGIIVVSLFVSFFIGALTVRGIGTSVNDSSFSVPNLSAQIHFGQEIQVNGQKLLRKLKE